MVLVNCMAHWISQTVLVLLQEKDSRKWSGKQGFGQSILSVMLKGMENHHRRQSREVTTSDGHLFEYLLSWDHPPAQHPPEPKKKEKLPRKSAQGKHNPKGCLTRDLTGSSLKTRWDGGAVTTAKELKSEPGSRRLVTWQMTGAQTRPRARALLDVAPGFPTLGQGPAHLCKFSISAGMLCSWLPPRLRVCSARSSSNDAGTSWKQFPLRLSIWRLRQSGDWARPLGSAPGPPSRLFLASSVRRPLSASSSGPSAVNALPLTSNSWRCWKPLLSARGSDTRRL